MDAIVAFRHALKWFKHKVLSLSPNSQLQCPQGHRLALCRWSIDCLDESNVQQVSPNNMFDVFKKAFALPMFEEFVSHSHEELAIVLFYNLGLAHHLAGLTPGSADTKQHLHRAQRFYEISFSLLCSAEVLKFDSSSNTLMLGLVANMGHIYSHYWKMDDAMSCQTRLSELLDSGALVGLTEEEQSFFFSTLATGEAAHKIFLAPAA